MGSLFSNSSVIDSETIWLPQSNRQTSTITKENLNNVKKPETAAWIDNSFNTVFQNKADNQTWSSDAEFDSSNPQWATQKCINKMINNHIKMKYDVEPIGSKSYSRFPLQPPNKVFLINYFVF